MGLGPQIISAGLILALVGVALAAAGVSLTLSVIDVQNYAYVSKSYTVRQDGCWALYQAIRDPQAPVTPDTFNNKLPVLWAGATEEEARANLANSTWVAYYGSYKMGGQIVYSDCCCWIVKWYSWKFIEDPPPSNGTNPPPPQPQPGDVVPPEGSPRLANALNVVTLAGLALVGVGLVVSVARGGRR
ncbi:MAG: hypothetical protein ACQXXL_03495 [Candidatus Methanosuratincola sp.]